MRAQEMLQAANIAPAKDTFCDLHFLSIDLVMSASNVCFAMTMCRLGFCRLGSACPPYGMVSVLCKNTKDEPDSRSASRALDHSPRVPRRV